MVISLFISNLLEAVKKFVKTVCTPMFRDERGVLEPHADLLSVALAVIGFMVLAALMSQTYLGYEDRSFALENYESASLLAKNLAEAPVLKVETSSLLSAAALDELSGPEGIRERERFFAAFSGNYLFLVEIRTGDGQWHWRIEPDNAEPESLMEGREKVAASVPVIIELNPAESVPGILTVVLYKTAWK
ncbi:MAG TPA: hypothetical protein VN373_02345 [Methanosarcina barkeri]|nr:hypothetical protein [Methanosarcina barkeri]